MTVDSVWRRGRFRSAAVCLLLTAVASSCANSKATVALPGQPLTVSSLLREYAIDLDNKPGAPGRIVLRIRNEGTVDHQFIMFRIPEEVTGTLDEQLRSDTRRSAPPIRTIGSLSPGQGTFFALVAMSA